ncbi:MAG: LPS assembly lipoprotein LptE [Candidatus Omnitrophica bacterium]|nr:LPS assembly lipoprotein LptE [Candidatus Omnitrophota bacterium]
MDARRFLLIWGGLLVLGCGGCAGYKLGPTSGMPAGTKSIQVNLFENKTMEPRLIEYVATTLRRDLQQDGTYRLATAGDGDVVVNGVIIDFNRSELSLQPTDVLTVRDYWLSMTAQITARDRATGKIILDSKVTGRSTIRVGANLTAAEEQAIPLMAEDLARKATSLLVNGEW